MEVQRLTTMMTRTIPIAVLWITVCSYLPTVVALTVGTNPPISVWDNVLSLESRHQLHQAATASGLGHFCFRRGAPATLMEGALDQILQELPEEGTEEYVEYWARQEWRHIEAHADVDENLAKVQDAERGYSAESFRYPTWGHVLYLQVGTNVTGPTCLFPSRSSVGTCCDTLLL